MQGTSSPPPLPARHETPPSKRNPKDPKDLGLLTPNAIRAYVRFSGASSRGGKTVIQHFRGLDANSDGELTFEEFLQGVRLMGFFEATEEEAQFVFAWLDKDGSGTVPYGELDKRLRDKPMLTDEEQNAQARSARDRALLAASVGTDVNAPPAADGDKLSGGEATPVGEHEAAGSSTTTAPAPHARADTLLLEWAETMQRLASQCDERAEARRTAIADAGGIPPLLGLLRGGVAAKTLLAAIDAIAWLTLNERCIESVRRARGAQLLVRCLTGRFKGSGSEVAAHAARALGNLAASPSFANRKAVQDAGGIKALVSVLAEGPASNTANGAAVALCNLLSGDMHDGSLDSDVHRAAAMLLEAPSMLKLARSKGGSARSGAGLSGSASARNVQRPRSQPLQPQPLRTKISSRPAVRSAFDAAPRRASGAPAVGIWWSPAPDEAKKEQHNEREASPCTCCAPPPPSGSRFAPTASAASCWQEASPAGNVSSRPFTPSSARPTPGSARAAGSHTWPPKHVGSSARSSAQPFGDYASAALGSARLLGWQSSRESYANTRGMASRRLPGEVREGYWPARITSSVVGRDATPIDDTVADRSKSPGDDDGALPSSRPSCSSPPPEEEAEAQTGHEAPAGEPARTSRSPASPAATSLASRGSARSGTAEPRQGGSPRTSSRAAALQSPLDLPPPGAASRTATPTPRCGSARTSPPPEEEAETQTGHEVPAGEPARTSRSPASPAATSLASRGSARSGTAEPRQGGSPRTSSRAAALQSPLDLPPPGAASRTATPTPRSGSARTCSARSSSSRNSTREQLVAGAPSPFAAGSVWPRGATPRAAFASSHSRLPSAEANKATSSPSSKSEGATTMHLRHGAHTPTALPLPSATGAAMMPTPVAESSSPPPAPRLQSPPAPLPRSARSTAPPIPPQLPPTPTLPPRLAAAGPPSSFHSRAAEQASCPAEPHISRWTLPGPVPAPVRRGSDPPSNPPSAPSTARTRRKPP